MSGDHAGSGLFSSAMTEDFSAVLGPPLQNPLMHLTEAWLAAREATGDPVFDRRLEKLAAAFAQAFVHRGNRLHRRIADRQRQ